jgi:hypothetical protein
VFKLWNVDSLMVIKLDLFEFFFDLVSARLTK